MQDLNQIADEVLREMVQLDDQIANARQINYEENELKRSTLQKMVHKFRFEIGENKAEVEEYIKVNLPAARNNIKEKINYVLKQLQKQSAILLKQAKVKRKHLKRLARPLVQTLKSHRQIIKEGHDKYSPYFRNRNRRKYLRQQTPEQRSEQNISIILGIVTLTIIELLLLILSKYVDNQVPKNLAIAFGVIIGGMFLYMIILTLRPMVYKALVNKEIKLLEKVREDIQLEGLTPADIKQQGRKIKNDLVNVRVALERDRNDQG